MAPEWYKAFDTLLNIGVFVLALILAVLGMAKWILARERQHITDDDQKHRTLEKELKSITQKQADADGAMRALMSTQQMIIAMFTRLENQVSSQIQQMEARFNSRFEQAERTQEASANSIVNQIRELVKTIKTTNE